MARLRSTKAKSKEFIFTSYDNDKDKLPAKVIFKSFPRSKEFLTYVNDNEILEGVEVEKADKKAIESKLMDNIIKSISSGRINYKKFFEDHVESFNNFEFEASKILTVNDFFQVLPEAAIDKIAEEIYLYAFQADEFSMGE